MAATATERALLLADRGWDIFEIAAALGCEPEEVLAALKEGAEIHTSGGGGPERFLEGESSPRGRLVRSAGWLFLDKSTAALWLTIPLRAWEAEADYREGALVTFADKTWEAIARSEGSQPDISPELWEEVTSRGEWVLVGGAGDIGGERGWGVEQRSDSGWVQINSGPGAGIYMESGSRLGAESEFELASDLIRFRAGGGGEWRFNHDGSLEHNGASVFLSSAKPPDELGVDGDVALTHEGIFERAEGHWTPFTGAGEKGERGERGERGEAGGGGFEQFAQGHGAPAFGSHPTGWLYQDLDSGAVWSSIAPRAWNNEPHYRRGVVVTEGGKFYRARVQIGRRETAPSESPEKWEEIAATANWVMLLGGDEQVNEEVRFRGEQLEAPGGTLQFTDGKLFITSDAPNSRVFLIQDNTVEPSDYVVTIGQGIERRLSVWIAELTQAWWIDSDGFEVANSKPGGEPSLEPDEAASWYDGTTGAAAFIREGKDHAGTVVRTKAKMLPLNQQPEQGRTGELAAGAHAIAAPHVTATSVILVTLEGAEEGTVRVSARKAAEGFTVTITGGGAYFINWSIAN